MKVHIDGGLYLESDAMQYILKDYTGRTDKEGRDVYNVLGYFGSIEGAIQKLVDLKIRESKADNLGQLLLDLNEVRSYITSRFGE